MKNSPDCAARLRELEIKITFLEDYVSKQNQVLVEQGALIEKMRKALLSLAEKTETLGGGNADAMPADEKPPHW